MAFAFLHFLEALFDGAFADEFVDEDGFVLADAVGAVGGLVFGGGVPPRVVVNDGVGVGEGESGASGFEGDEEDVGSSGLELLDHFLAVFARASELEIGGVGLDEMLLDDIEHGGELGEEEDFAVFFFEGF